MKKIGWYLFLAALTFTSCGSAMAQSTNLDNSLQVGGITSLIADKAKEAQGAGLVDLHGNFGAGGYLPIWTFHDKDGVNYFRVGLGGKGKAGEKPSPLVPFLVNLPGLSGRLWDFQWSKDHVTRASFPDIWAGPYIEPPLNNGWTWRGAVGGMVAIGLGGGK